MYNSMDELLAKTGKVLNSLTYGDLVEGRIVSISRNQILVDVKAKSEGIIAQKEIAENPEPYRKLQVGQNIVAFVLQPENERGYVVLSLRKAAGASKWRELEAAFQKGETLKVQIAEYNKGGFLVETSPEPSTAATTPIVGFIPLTHLSRARLSKMKDPQDLIGTPLEVKIIELNQKQNRLVFSEKEAQNGLSLLEREKILSSFKVGDVLEGEISSILPFGLFIEVSGVEGLCHISEVAWEKVEDLNSLFKVGQKVKVKVLEVEPKENKLALSIRELLSNPWETVDQKFKVGDRVTGTVSKIVPFGAFVSLAPGLEGLIHVSETIGPMQVGEKVETEVIDVDAKRQRLGLSVRKLQEVSFTYK